MLTVKSDQRGRGSIKPLERKSLAIILCLLSADRDHRHAQTIASGLFLEVSAPSVSVSAGIIS